MAVSVFPRLHLSLRLILLVASLLGAAPAFAQQVVVERETELRSEPRPDASVVATLKQGTQGDVVATKGVWLHLKTASATGWTFSFNVRYGSSQSSSGGSGAGAALSRLTTRQQPSIQPVIGVRGLDPDTLRNAPFNEGQVAQLERYRSTDRQARAGAASSGLKASHIEYLDAK